MRHLAPSVLGPAALLFMATAAIAQTPQDATSKPTAQVPLRIGILGASVSAGFGCQLTEPRPDGIYQAQLRLADMLPLACPDTPMIFQDTASGSMFFDPQQKGSEAVAAVAKFKPDCVVAVDFLFWYCYGTAAKADKERPDAEWRLQRLEQGLAALDTFQVPVLVGDLPDMSGAVGKILGKSQMPALPTLELANKRIAAWAKDRPLQRVLPLAAMIKQLQTDKAIEIAGKKFAATEQMPLLQRDELHTTPAGLAAVACVIVSELQQVSTKRPVGCAVDPATTLERARGRLAKAPEPQSKRALPAEPQPASGGGGK